jgi:hypothetical protein
VTAGRAAWFTLLLLPSSRWHVVNADHQKDTVAVNVSIVTKIERKCYQKIKCHAKTADQLADGDVLECVLSAPAKKQRNTDRLKGLLSGRKTIKRPKIE